VLIRSLELATAIVQWLLSEREKNNEDDEICYYVEIFFSTYSSKHIKNILRPQKQIQYKNKNK
jgi:hypothetical protein